MDRGKIPYRELFAYTATILEKLGYSKEQAEVTATILVEADARGVRAMFARRSAPWSAVPMSGRVSSGAAGQRRQSPRIQSETAYTLPNPRERTSR